MSNNLKNLCDDINDKLEKSRYYNYFLEPKDQYAFFEQAYNIINEHADSLNEHANSLKVLENAHQYAYNEITILIEDLKDTKFMTFTRESLMERLNKLLKKMKANIP